MTIENALQSFYVYLDGYSGSSQSGVATLVPVPNADLRIYPNPSEGITNIELTGLTSANVEVLDVLGNSVARSVPLQRGPNAGADVWQWNAESGGLANGSYFVRATGRNAIGREVVVTKSLVVDRQRH